MKKVNMGKRGAAALLILLAGAAVLCAAGGKLAQPERQEPARDKFIGFQLVYERMSPSVDMSDPEWEEELKNSPLEDRSQWVEYGSINAQAEGIGNITIPREILIGRYDEDSGRYLFPGKEGFNCFLAVQVRQDGSECVSAGADMADVQIGLTDEEDYVRGTVYFGPPLDDKNWNTEDFDYYWTAYRVYQMDDGTVYLDGSGNSYGGVGGVTVSASEREARTTTVNGKAETKAFKAEFTIAGVERVTSIDLKWFDAEDRLVEADTLAPEDIGDGLTLNAPESACWALVEEADRTGAVKRSVYTLDGEEKTAHQMVLLDRRGLGRVVFLTLEAGA